MSSGRFSCDCQVISVKKLHLITRLHISEQSWSKTAEHCCRYHSSKVTMQFLFLNIFCIAPGENTKHHRWLFVSIAGGSTALWLWQWPSYCRTQKTWISSWSSLTTGKSSWLPSRASWRRLSMLSVNRSVPSSKASPSGSPSAPHRTSKDKLRHQRRLYHVLWLPMIIKHNQLKHLYLFY